VTVSIFFQILSTDAPSKTKLITTLLHWLFLSSLDGFPDIPMNWSLNDFLSNLQYSYLWQGMVPHVCNTYLDEQDTHYIHLQLILHEWKMRYLLDHEFTLESTGYVSSYCNQLEGKHQHVLHQGHLTQDLIHKVPKYFPLPL